MLRTSAAVIVEFKDVAGGVVAMAMLRPDDRHGRSGLQRCSRAADDDDDEQQLLVRKECRGGELARQILMAMSTGMMGDGPPCRRFRMWRTLRTDNRFLQLGQ